LLHVRRQPRAWCLIITNAVAPPARNSRRFIIVRASYSPGATASMCLLLILIVRAVFPNKFLTNTSGTFYTRPTYSAIVNGTLVRTRIRRVALCPISLFACSASISRMVLLFHLVYGEKRHKFSARNCSKGIGGRRAKNLCMRPASPPGSSTFLGPPIRGQPATLVASLPGVAHV